MSLFNVILMRARTTRYDVKKVEREVMPHPELFREPSSNCEQLTLESSEDWEDRGFLELNGYLLINR